MTTLNTYTQKEQAFKEGGTMNPQFKAGAIAFIKSKFRAAPCGLSMQERKEWYKGYDNCNPDIARKIMENRK